MKTNANKVLRCGMMRTRRVFPVMLMLACICPAVVQGDEQSAVQTTLIAEVREPYVSAEGKEGHRFVPAGVLAQGDIVFYSVQIRNPTTIALRDVAVVQRIPANTTYVPDSAAGPSTSVTFSVDGGKTFASAKGLMIQTEGNAPRPATPADYTHIRWQLRNALAPGAVALARFQAVFR